MAKNSEYWEKRIASEIWKVYNSLEEKNKELLQFYIEASESVKDELYRLAEKYSKDGVLSLSEMYKQNRLAELNKKYENIIEELGRTTEEFAKKNMQQGFQNVYEKTAKGMGDNDFSMPNKKLMEKMMETPWRGDNFSGRLWKNQKKLAVSLNDVLLTGLQQGKTVTEIAIALHNRMGQGFNECHRLVRTESMHYLNDAALRRYKDAGVEYVQIWAALDERTCDTCGGYHEKIYPIDKCPAVPLHANCRCTVLPVMDEKVSGKKESYVVEDMKLMDTTDKWAEEARKELLESEKSVASRSKEITEIYGPDGKYIMTKRGDSNSVRFSARDYFKLKDAIVTHNHPSGGTFSVQDIKFLKRTLISELRVSTEECVYYIRKPKQWPKEISTGDKIEKAIVEIKKDLKQKYQKMYNEGKIDKVQRHIMFRDEVIHIFAERYGLEYGCETYE